MADTTTNLNISLIQSSDYISPDPINTAFKTLDALGVDYITERGTKGDWWYRKWKSGRAECGIDKYTGATKTSVLWQEGSHMYICGEYSAPSAFPVTFSTPPMTVVMYRGESGSGPQGGIIHIHSRTGTDAYTLAPKFSIVDAAGPHTYTTPIFGIYVTGTTK